MRRVELEGKYLCRASMLSDISEFRPDLGTGYIVFTKWKFR